MLAGHHSPHDRGRKTQPGPRARGRGNLATAQRRMARSAAFTLVELLISLTLVMLLTLALLTSYVFIARGDRSLQNYGEMNSQARKLLEQLGEDLRAATDVTDFTASSVTLTVPTNTSA